MSARHVAVGSDFPRVWWDLAINGEDAGRITIELRTDVAPITCQNFL